MKSILLVKKLLGLAEMTSGLVNASFSVPEWQAVNMIFFAPWLGHLWRIEQCMSWVIYGTLNSVYFISLQVVKWTE